MHWATYQAALITINITPSTLSPVLAYSKILAQVHCAIPTLQSASRVHLKCLKSHPSLSDYSQQNGADQTQKGQGKLH